jgi:hypothetical protein
LVWSSPDLPEVRLSLMRRRVVTGTGKPSSTKLTSEGPLRSQAIYRLAITFPEALDPDPFPSIWVSGVTAASRIRIMACTRRTSVEPPPTGRSRILEYARAATDLSSGDDVAAAHDDRLIGVMRRSRGLFDLRAK